MRLAMSMLGAVSPQVQAAMEERVGQLEALEEQAINDVVLLGRQGANISRMQEVLDAVNDTIIELRAQIQQFNDDQAESWFSVADQTEVILRSLLQSLGGQRARAAEWARYQGLFWGLGVSAAVVGLAVYVWRKRKRR